MDDARRLQILRTQISEANGGYPSDFGAWQQRTFAALRVTMGVGHPVMKAFEEVSYSLGFITDMTPDSAFAEAQVDGVKQAIAIMEGVVHEIEISAPEGLLVSASMLHPWVAGAVAGLWDDGHHRAAVDEATRAIEVRLKAKIGSQATGTPLVTDAFSPAAPRAGQQRLRFPQYEDGSQSWTNAHEGAMAFGRGCMMRIRNLLEHEDAAVEQQVAVECLAALSLLARWIDEAIVVSAD